jgi:uncharacterized repeat protein (TIGR01451 family)
MTRAGWNPAGLLLAFAVASALANAQGTITFPIDPTGSYLFVNTGGSTPDVATPPLVINLLSIGAQPGDQIVLTAGGLFSFTCYPGVAGSCVYQPAAGILCGLFTASATIDPPFQLNRVPGAIQPPVGGYHPCTTGATLFGGLPTDIPQDFLVDTTPVTVPQGAQYLIVAVQDVFYADNAGEPTVTIAVQQRQLTAVNPFAYSATWRQTPQAVDVGTALQAPLANSVAADGQSAVLLMYQSQSPQPVTFKLSSGSAGASLSSFDANYLKSPNPPGSPILQLPPQVPQNDCATKCVFLALLWGAKASSASSVSLTVTASQAGGANPETATITMVPPPLLLVHGIWSSASGAGFSAGAQGFYDWITGFYPSQTIIAPVDYGAFNYKSFDDPSIQGVLLQTMGDTLARAAGEGVAARTVDVVAHSMGGLVTRYFLSQNGAAGNPALLAHPVHQLITVGTPHLGSQLAKTLVDNKNAPVIVSYLPTVALWCLSGTCTLGSVMSMLGDTVDTGAQSLAPNSSQLQRLLPSSYYAIEGVASSPSCTEGLLNLLINAFVPGKTVQSLLGTPHDTIVAESSQIAGAALSYPIPGIVHTNLAPCWNVGETASLDVWTRVYQWLTGTQPPTSFSAASEWLQAAATTPPAPVFDLTGYTQVPASNVTITPASGSTLAINSAASITATSSKGIAQVILVQTLTGPNDTPMLAVTQAPFTIVFTPTRMGSTTFSAFTLFSDKTYAVTPLSYNFQTTGNPVALRLIGAPEASMALGAAAIVRANSQFAGGMVDVTAAATYTTASGGTGVFRIGSGGNITATGNGLDRLNVSYAGVSTSVPITVGTCPVSLSPPNQIVPFSGAAVTVQVTAPPGCAWTATGGAPWLTLNMASGFVLGSIILTAAANNTGGARVATVSLGGQSAFVIQPAAACSYSLSPTQISAGGAGASGSISVTTACPIVAWSNGSWVTATVQGSTVQYTIAPNSGAARTAVLTVGTVAVTVSQTAGASLGIALSHFGTLTQGVAATYSVTVSNSAAGVMTAGSVTVTDTLPSGMTLVSMTGTGWTCASGGTSCTRSDALNPGSSYPPLLVTANVARNAGSPLINLVTVSGGGSAPATAADVAAVATAPPTQSRIGIFNSGQSIFLLDTNGNFAWDGTPTDMFFPWGTANHNPKYIVVTGDWNGSGTKKVGIFDPANAIWLLDYNGDGIYTPGVDKYFAWGSPGDIPIVGDWNGSGTTKVGTFGPTTGLWLLDYNGNYSWDGPGIDKYFPWGSPGDTPVVGDWNGTGSTKVGTLGPKTGLWLLDYNGNFAWDGPGVDKYFPWGSGGDTPVIGDWNGSGTAKVGTFGPKTGLWLLDYNGNFSWDGPAVDKYFPWGSGGDMPVVGDWNGSGTTKVGTFGPSTALWLLDYNGNVTWDGPGVDKYFPWGSPGDTPVISK